MTIFIENKYTRWYFNIIASTKTIKNGYCENHHIIPKSLGGNDEKSNIIRVPAKTHYILHHLLVKMCRSPKHRDKMISAYFFMHISSHSNNQRSFTPRSYEFAKHIMAEAKRESMRGKGNHMYGKKLTDEHRKKLSSKRLNIPARNVDNTMYNFTHPYHGTRYYRRIDLCKEFDLKHGLLGALIKGKVASSQGWKVI